MEPGSVDPASVITLEDPLEIRRFLEEAGDAHARALIGIENADERHETEVLLFDRVTSTLQVMRPEGMAPEVLHGKLCFILIFSRGVQALGFTARVAAGREGELRFEFPKKAFQLQRRREVRVNIPGGYDLALKFHSTVTRGKRDRRKLLDLSSEGFAFLVTSEEEAARFAVGRFVREILFEVHGRSILFDAQIRNHFMLGEFRTKIGASFLRLKPDDREFIEALCLTRMASFILSRGFTDESE